MKTKTILLDVGTLEINLSLSYFFLENLCLISCFFWLLLLKIQGLLSYLFGNITIPCNFPMVHKLRAGLLCPRLYPCFCGFCFPLMMFCIVRWLFSFRKLLPPQISPTEKVQLCVDFVSHASASLHKCILVHMFQTFLKVLCSVSHMSNIFLKTRTSSWFHLNQARHRYPGNTELTFII